MVLFIPSKCQFPICNWVWWECDLRLQNKPAHGGILTHIRKVINCVLTTKPRVPLTPLEATHYKVVIVVSPDRAFGTMGGEIITALHECYHRSSCVV